MNCIGKKLRNGRCKCVLCGKVYPSPDCTAKSICKVPNPLPLGDWAAWIFGKLRITEERYNAARGSYRICGGFNCVLVRVDPEKHKCGCQSRQERWNARGARLSTKWPFRWLTKRKRAKISQETTRPKTSSIN